MAGGVTLATLHTAKGLEWDAVFVVGVCEGTLPITYAESPTEVEEERRLLYVGITRARHTLAVSWAWARNPGGRATRQPSRFLDPLLPAGARTQPTGACVPVCGNGFCEIGESHASCANDCCEIGPNGTCALVCGNGFCETGETQASCSTDC